MEVDDGGAPAAYFPEVPKPARPTSAGLFPALLKRWRAQRGLSQLDLAVAADVSSRHVSFLETGRSVPSPGMVLRLAAALDVQLRYVSALLQAAGHEAQYPTVEPGGALPEAARPVVEMMKAHHERFPLLVMDRSYDIRDLNLGAMALLSALRPGRPLPNLNLVRFSFDPEGVQPLITNFEEVGPALLWRLQREVLAEPDDGPLRTLLDEAVALPTAARRSAR